MHLHPAWTWSGVWAGKARCSRSLYVVSVMIAAAMPRLGTLFIVAVVIGFLVAIGQRESQLNPLTRHDNLTGQVLRGDASSRPLHSSSPGRSLSRSRHDAARIWSCVDTASRLPEGSTRNCENGERFSSTSLKAPTIAPISPTFSLNASHGPATRFSIGVSA